MIYTLPRPPCMCTKYCIQCNLPNNLYYITYHHLLPLFTYSPITTAAASAMLYCIHLYPPPS